MPGIDRVTLSFLKDLDKHNTREWFQEHKPRYETAKANFEAFVTDLIGRIGAFDEKIGGLQARKAIFRIYRDTRFSKDKRPYKTNMGAHLVAHASKVHDRAGYYLHLEPGKSFLAGGAYLPPGPWIKAIREEIAYNAEEFKGLINAASFRQYFGDLEGEKLKTAPKGYPKDHPEIDLLRYKSFLAVHNLTDKQVLDANFAAYCATVFQALKPLDDFLNRTLDD